MADITVTIEGVTDSTAEYNDEDWLAADASLRMAIDRFYQTGATVANIAEAVKGGLEEATEGER